MSKSFKLSNNIYLDTRSIVHGRQILADILYPVGSIYISTKNTNPSTYFGGTWVEFGSGKTLVGINTGDTDFNTVEKTGGHKELQNHTHSMEGAGRHRHDLDGNDSSLAKGSSYVRPRSAGAATAGQYHTTYVENHTHTINSTGGGTSYADSPNNGNLPPYIVVYMFKRTK